MPQPDKEMTAMQRPSRRIGRGLIRLLEILRLLVEGRLPPLYKLSRQFAVSERTIRRDVDRLSELGYKIQGDDQKGLTKPKLAPESEHLGTVPLTEDEVLDLLFWAAYLARNEKGLPFCGFHHRALRKLRCLVGHAERGLDACEMAECVRFAINDPQFDWPAGTLIEALLAAIMGNRRCKVAYQHSLRDEHSRFSYDPARIVQTAQGFFCIGRRVGEDVWLTLDLARMRDLKITAERSAVDRKDPALDSLFGAVVEKPMVVALKLTGESALEAVGRCWHETQKVKSLDDGSVLLTFRAGGRREIVRWILGFGDNAEVLQPQSLRAEVAKILDGARARYVEPVPFGGISTQKPVTG